MELATRSSSRCSNVTALTLGDTFSRVRETLKRRRGLRIVAWITGSLVLAVLLLDLLFVQLIGLHVNGAEGAPYMRDSAQELAIQPGWKLLVDNQDLNGDCLFSWCPSLEQTYDIGSGPVSCVSLQRILTDSGFTVIVHRDIYTPQANDELRTCGGAGEYLVAQGTAAGGALGVDAWIKGDNPEAPGRNTLVIRFNKQP